jgi:hypothetical protein
MYSWDQLISKFTLLLLAVAETMLPCGAESHEDKEIILGAEAELPVFSLAK